VHLQETKFTWISKEQIEMWAISQAELAAQADKNANELLEQTDILFDDIEGRKLGQINVAPSSLKGPLLFASGMKNKIEYTLGFPFYAVLPVRDFCYLFSENDVGFFAEKIGNIVVEEYKQSGYPITTEVLKFSDKGVEGVGKYPV
jgi:hypothetical protein